MPAISCSAPGKIILCGEHAVVYGKPAIAIPVFNVATNCRIIAQPTASSNETLIAAPGIGLRSRLSSLRENHPIRKAIEFVLDSMKLDHLPSCEIHINSSIPSAAGLGSSASTSIALVRALSMYLGHPFDDAEVSRIAFEIEKIHHGTPSGIDTTVITYGKPLFFIKNYPYELLHLRNSITLVIADTGIKSSTAKVVAEVRSNWEKSHREFENYFDQIQDISRNVKRCLESGNNLTLGELLNRNHCILIEMGISCSKLDILVKCALENGAQGAKLSGGGQGGNIIALVSSEKAETVAEAIRHAGAVNTIITRVPSEDEKTK
ncbi:MAG: mevalonate kinase [Anaerolinea sp.]|nr:mevalonate kinase [Anaerolinea sp.]